MASQFEVHHPPEMNNMRVLLVIILSTVTIAVRAQVQIPPESTSATDAEVRIQKHKKSFHINHHMRTGREIQGENQIFTRGANVTRTGREAQGENHIYKGFRHRKAKKFKGHSSVTKARVFHRHNHFKEHATHARHKSGPKKISPRN
jgi:hypothetical protein